MKMIKADVWKQMTQTDNAGHEVWSGTLDVADAKLEIPDFNSPMPVTSMLNSAHQAYAESSLIGQWSFFQARQDVRPLQIDPGVYL